MSSGMVASYMLGSRKSAYHDSCMPKQHASTQASVGPPVSDAQARGCDLVTQDKIWRQAVASERRCLENWGENWGFLTEYDSKGQPIARAELPDKVTVFSGSVPNTNSGNYGSRLQSEAGQTMQQLEFQFYSDRRRRKLDSEMVCY